MVYGWSLIDHDCSISTIYHVINSLDKFDIYWYIYIYIDICYVHCYISIMVPICWFVYISIVIITTGRYITNYQLSIYNPIDRLCYNHINHYCLYQPCPNCWMLQIGWSPRNLPELWDRVATPAPSWSWLQHLIEMEIDRSLAGVVFRKEIIYINIIYIYILNII